MTAHYTPALRPAELRAASFTLASAACLVDARGGHTRDTAAAIDATGFGGPAADAGLRRLDTYAQRFVTHAHMLRYVAAILASAGSAQQKLDEFAELAVHTQRSYLIEWLNMLSWLLDTAAAQALRSAVLGTPDPTFDELVHHPNDTLEQLHRRHLRTVPAATAEAVQRAGGLIVEAGPERTSVIVGATTGADPDRVITLVGGVSTGRPAKLAADLERARTIAAATGAAVVVWQGYHPPADVAEGIDPGAARTGGEKLSAFQLALADRFPAARRTVVAHSYGTVVATRAATGAGMFADDVWLLGSPGVPARSVDDMKLHGDGRVFVVDADRDPILALRYRERGVHGTSPSHPSFGATNVPGVEGGHLAYFDDPDLLRALVFPPPP